MSGLIFIGVCFLLGLVLIPLLIYFGVIIYDYAKYLYISSKLIKKGYTKSTPYRLYSGINSFRNTRFDKNIKGYYITFATWVSLDAINSVSVFITEVNAYEHLIESGELKQNVLIGTEDENYKFFEEW